MYPMNSPESTSEDHELLARLIDRITTRWLTKMVSNVLAILLFLGAYFWVLNYPRIEAFEMPLTALDRWIAFRPGAIVLYASLWLYVSLPLALLTRKHEMLAFGVAAICLALLGLTMFMIWPTTTPAFQIDWSQHPSSAFLKDLDGNGNACPSLHVAFSIFSAVWLQRLLRQMRANQWIQIANWIWCAAILYSTIATRQHVVLNVIAGAVLGYVVVAANLSWLDRTGTPITHL